LPGVVSVGAVDARGKQAWFSNSGTGLTLVAPGVGIISGSTDSWHVIGSGTSPSAALTSGAVAHLLSRGYSAENMIPLLTGRRSGLVALAEIDKPSAGPGDCFLPKGAAPSDGIVTKIGTHGEMQHFFTGCSGLLDVGAFFAARLHRLRRPPNSNPVP